MSHVSESQKLQQVAKTGTIQLEWIRQPVAKGQRTTHELWATVRLGNHEWPINSPIANLRTMTQGKDSLWYVNIFGGPGWVSASKHLTKAKRELLSYMKLGYFVDEAKQNVSTSSKM